ncbi:site-specific DNA recombinase [Desulfohalotomaculum tongense]|uniref:recombinase family protein n=1 Tax=Desulforadius tongensis TaxID=1216062 RepID=UPI00195D16BB|nr:recombinase family protein [Desulforadius tongensis]MBM7856209.1 site-specific DNA recombinase [Desulforadius tongensis]
MKRGAVYIRVSNLRDDGVSPETQMEKAQLQAKLLGIDIVKVYEDLDISGRTVDKRIGFNQLIDDVKANKYDVVLVYRLDRFARNVRDFHHYMEILESHGTSLVSISQNIDTSSPTGRLLRNILIDFAQFESEMISERVKDNMIQNARRGSWNGGQKAYGMDWDEKNKQLVANENAKWVVLMFEEYAKNPGANRIRNILHRKGVLSPSGGKWWAPSTIRYILRNPIYVGKIEYAGEVIDGKHAPVVSQELFDRVQYLLSKNSELAPRTRDSRHLLSGLIKCPYCSRNLQARYNGKKRVRRYMCYTRINIGVHECRCKILDAESLENAVVSNLHSLSESGKVFDEARNTLKQIVQSLEKKQPDTERINKEKRLRKIRAAMKELFQDYYEEKIISREQFLRMNKEYLEEEKQLVSYLEEAQQVNDIYTTQVANLDLLQEQLTALKTAWPIMTFEEKKSVLRDVVQSITPYEDYVELDIFFIKLKLTPTKVTGTTLIF